MKFINGNIMCMLVLIVMEMFIRSDMSYVDYIINERNVSIYVGGENECSEKIKERVN